MKIDLLYCTYNRFAFTIKTFDLLVKNTNWNLVERLLIFDDQSCDGTEHLINTWRHLYDRNKITCSVTFHIAKFGGPVAIMRQYLADEPAEKSSAIFGKIDSDTALPPGWLDASLRTMQSELYLDLLGIEAWSTAVPWSEAEARRSYTPNPHIGGIGLMRRRAFLGRAALRPRDPTGRFGFTEWQHEHPEVTKGFIHPALPVALLDRIPTEPWTTLTQKYIERGWQRPWPPYPADSEADWKWVNEPIMERTK